MTTDGPSDLVPTAGNDPAYRALQAHANPSQLSWQSKLIHYQRQRNFQYNKQTLTPIFIHL
jgi:hypothetical protein